MSLWAILTSDAWPAVQKQFFNWDRFVEVFPDMLGGFWLDIKMFLVAEVIILAVSLVIAMIRSLRGPAFFPLRALAVIFIDLIRGIPVILLILLLGFGVPALQLPGVPTGALFWGLTALGHQLQRLHGRGVPGGHRVGSREPADVGSLARAHPGPGTCGT